MTDTTVNIICLANSNKLGGRCVAGLELNYRSKPVRWIRLIGDNHPKGLTFHDYRYRNYQIPKVFDVINIPVVSHQPSSYHVENWLIDTSRYWYKRGEWDLDTTIKNLTAYIDNEPLWINGYSSSTGTNNRIPQELFGTLRSSLQLIIADDVTLLAKSGIDAKGTEYDRLDAAFWLDDERYVLRVTDPHILRQYSHINNDFNALELGRCLMTISLSEPFNGFAYKLVAHIEPFTPVEFDNE